MYILGDVLLKHFYQVYNYEVTDASPKARRIGIAVNKKYPESESKDNLASIIRYENIRHQLKKFLIIQALTVCFTAFVYVGFHFCQVTRMNIRVEIAVQKNMMNKSIERSESVDIDDEKDHAKSLPTE